MKLSPRGEVVPLGMKILCSPLHSPKN
jgi:hypothetical protein